MGINAGFDMVPRLDQGAFDRLDWDSFVNAIKNRYVDDDLVDFKPNYIEFKVGDHPLIPYEGHKFLRFSSKLSTGVDDYIVSVFDFAKGCFGSRVRYWNENASQQSFYGWEDVRGSLRSYEQPDEPLQPTSITQLLFGIDPFRHLNIKLFEVQPVTGKGKGLVARLNISKGTRILSEHPLLKVQNNDSTDLLNKSIATKLKELSKPEQRQFLSLYNNFPGKYPFAGIVKTNCLQCGPDSPIGAVYPNICLINHSCSPNAHNNWNSDTNTETIHALRNIKAGEEITISYSADGPSTTRRAHLKANFGFDCICEVCSLPASELLSSDIRRLDIQSLDTAIADPQRLISQPHDCVGDCQRLQKLLVEEYKDTAAPQLVRLYYDAFQISITHGDQARASVFAERGYKARVLCKGEDSLATQKIKKLMETPAQHRAYGLTTKWKTAKKLVPKGLDASAFEKWLWRQEN